MAKLLIAPLLLIFPFYNCANAQGIIFFEGTWKEALSEAAKQGRIVFVDAYATWCGPCKMMTRNVFTEKAVGDFFNENFINVRIDMEAGEGILFAGNYGVDAYPSLLFIDGDAKVVHRSIGYHNAPEFLNLGRTALDPSRRLSFFEGRYAAGDRDPEFLHDYALASHRALNFGQAVLVEEYLQTQADWSTEKNLRFIFTFVDDVDSELFDYLARNRADFEALFGSQAVISRIQNLIMEEAFSEDAGPEALEKVDRLFAKAYPEVAGRLSALFRMNYFQYTGDMESYAEATVYYFGTFPTDNATELNNAAWNFFELVEDVEMLETALGWAERSVDLDGQYYNYDTLACLYFKLGKKRKARKAAEYAIEIARNNGEDYSPTEALLRQIDGR